MDDILYEVRIIALLPGGIPPEQIHAAFADLFCLTPAEAERRLSTLPLLVRGNLSLEQASKYQRVLSRAAMACEVRPQLRVPTAEAVPLLSPGSAAATAAGGQA